ncbi:MAG: response regulator [Verrucomicrobia bacterium]|nr:response regulator [Verrucomicrobiota bacterium]
MNPEQAASPPSQPLELKVKHILVVDDDVELAQSYKELLESYGYLVTTVPNGVEALKTIMNMDVDAILCDLMMPHMAGDMFYVAVERVKPHLCQRFIFVTAYEGHPQFAPFLKRVNAVALYKPVTLGKLLGTLNVLFSRTSSGAKKG